MSLNRKLSTIIFLSLFLFNVNFLVNAETSYDNEINTPEETTPTTEYTIPFVNKPQSENPPDWYADGNTSEPNPADVFGNAQLVEEENILFENEKFTFISIKTRNNNVFYVFIDHRIEDGQANVFFLNKVDEYDLLSLIYEPAQSGEADPNKPVHPYENGKPISTGNADPDQSTTSAPQTGENGDPATDEPTKSSPIGSFQIIVLVFVVLAGIGLFVYLQMSKKKSAPVRKSNYEEEEDNFDTDEE